MTGDPVAEGAMLLDQNRPAEALTCFEQSDDARARFGRGVALQMLGRWEEAEAAYLRVIEAHPHEEALANLIALAIEKFDLERVERYSRQLVNLNPDAVIGWQGLVVVAVERRDFGAAAEYFARVDGRAIADERAIQYRLSGHIADRLRGEWSREKYGAVARSR